jgi:hypothetical protein
MKAHSNLKQGYASIFSRIDKAKAFIKYEKAKIEKVLDDRKPARLIQHRSYEYLYLLKSLMLPMSKHLKTNDNLYNGQKISTMFASGKNSYEIAALLHDMWNQFIAPVALLLDCSSWDGHVNELQRSEASKFWESIVVGNKPDVKLLRRLLRMQKSNTVVTHHLLRYIVEYIRLSGEWTTSDENSLLNIALIEAVFDILNIRILVMGDDSVVIMEQSDYQKFTHAQIVEAYAAIGHDVKIDKVCFDFREIDFCQTSPIRVNGTWRMVRNPIRAISRAQFTHFDWDPLERYLTAIGLCELACGSGVPVMQHFSCYLMEKGNYKRPVARVDREQAMLEGDIKVLPITAQARLDFEVAFGISISRQIELESLMEYTLNEKFLDRYKTFNQG